MGIASTIARLCSGGKFIGLSSQSASKRQTHETSLSSRCNAGKSCAVVLGDPLFATITDRPSPRLLREVLGKTLGTDKAQGYCVLPSTVELAVVRPSSRQITSARCKTGKANERPVMVVVVRAKRKYDRAARVACLELARSTCAAGFSKPLFDMDTDM